MLLTLFERVIVEADSALEAMVANPPTDLKTLWRTGINNRLTQPTAREAV